MARSHTNLAIKVLAGIAKDGTNEGARVSAAVALLDRGWGKPAQQHTGEDGEGGIEIIIRHTVEGRDAPRVNDNAEQRMIEHVPIDAAPDDAGES